MLKRSQQQQKSHSPNVQPRILNKSNLPKEYQSLALRDCLTIGDEQTLISCMQGESLSNLEWITTQRVNLVEDNSEGAQQIRGDGPDLLASKQNERQMQQDPLKKVVGLAPQIAIIGKLLILGQGRLHGLNQNGDMRKSRDEELKDCRQHSQVSILGQREQILDDDQNMSNLLLFQNENQQRRRGTVQAPKKQSGIPCNFRRISEMQGQPEQYKAGRSAIRCSGRQGSPFQVDMRIVQGNSELDIRGKQSRILDCRGGELSREIQANTPGFTNYQKNQQAEDTNSNGFENLIQMQNIKIRKQSACEEDGKQIGNTQADAIKGLNLKKYSQPKNLGVKQAEGSGGSQAEQTSNQLMFININLWEVRFEQSDTGNSSQAPQISNSQPLDGPMSFRKGGGQNTKKSLFHDRQKLNVKQQENNNPTAHSAVKNNNLSAFDKQQKIDIVNQQNNYLILEQPQDQKEDCAIGLKRQRNVIKNAEDKFHKTLPDQQSGEAAQEVPPREFSGCQISSHNVSNPGCSDLVFGSSVSKRKVGGPQANDGGPIQLSQVSASKPPAYTIKLRPFNLKNSWTDFLEISINSSRDFTALKAMMKTMCLQTFPPLDDTYTYIEQLGTGSQAKVDLYKRQRANEKSLVTQSPNRQTRTIQPQHYVNIPGKQFAVKTFTIKFEKSRSDLDGIFNEICFLRELKMCQNIAQLEEVYTSTEPETGQKRVSLVMKYAKHGTLLNYLFKQDGISEFQARTIMAQVLLSVDLIHRKNIIHRDLKPDNILIIDKADLKLCISDLGLACRVDDARLLRLRCGTPGYVAPEVLKGELFTTRSDIFSIGSLFFNVLTSSTLFKGATAKDVLHINKTLNPVPHIDEALKEFSSDCRDLIKNMLNVNPHERFNAEQCLNHNWFSKDREALQGSLFLNKNQSLLANFAIMNKIGQQMAAYNPIQPNSIAHSRDRLLIHPAQISGLNPMAQDDFISFIFAPNYFENLRAEPSMLQSAAQHANIIGENHEFGVITNEPVASFKNSKYSVPAQSILSGLNIFHGNQRIEAGNAQGQQIGLDARDVLISGCYSVGGPNLLNTDLAAFRNPHSVGRFIEDSNQINRSGGSNFPIAFLNTNGKLGGMAARTMNKQRMQAQKTPLNFCYNKIICNGRQLSARSKQGIQSQVQEPQKLGLLEQIQQLQNALESGLGKNSVTNLHMGGVPSLCRASENAFRSVDPFNHQQLESMKGAGVRSQHRPITSSRKQNNQLTNALSPKAQQVEGGQQSMHSQPNSKAQATLKPPQFRQVKKIISNPMSSNNDMALEGSARSKGGGGKLQGQNFAEAYENKSAFSPLKEKLVDQDRSSRERKEIDSSLSNNNRGGQAADKLSSTPPYILGVSSLNPQSMLYQHHQQQLGGTTTANLAGNGAHSNIGKAPQHSEVQFSSFGRRKKSIEKQQQKGIPPTNNQIRPFFPGSDNYSDGLDEVLDSEIEEYSTRPNRFQMEESGKVLLHNTPHYEFQLFSKALDLRMMTNIEVKLTARAHIDQILNRKHRDAFLKQKKEVHVEGVIFDSMPQQNIAKESQKKRSDGGKASHNVIAGGQVRVKRRIFMDQ